MSVPALVVGCCSGIRIEKGSVVPPRYLGHRLYRQSGLELNYFEICFLSLLSFSFAILSIWTFFKTYIRMIVQQNCGIAVSLETFGPV